MAGPRRRLLQIVIVACLGVAAAVVVIAARPAANLRGAPTPSVAASVVPAVPPSTYDQRLITDDTGDIDPPSIAPASTVLASRTVPDGNSASDPGSGASTAGPSGAPSIDGAVPAPSPQTGPTTVLEPSTTAPVNCAVAGSVSIPAIHVEQTILAESRPFDSGLLCGNEDGTTEGVDILPDYAPIVDSVAGGARLVGHVPAVIFGHRNSHNRPFLDIPELAHGDLVSVNLTGAAAIVLRVVDVVLLPLAQATTFVLEPSGDGTPTVRLVACARLDGSPGGTRARWIVTLQPV